MSDKPLSDSGPVIPTASALREYWPVNEISDREQRYLAAHNQIATDFMIAYPENRATEQAIAGQMSDLGTSLDGVLSWVSIVDPAKKQAEVMVVGFISNKELADKAAAGQGPQQSVADSATADEKEETKPAQIQIDTVERAAAIEQCQLDHLSKAADLFHLSVVPRSGNELTAIMDKRRLGLSEDAPRDVYETAVNAAFAADQKYGNAVSAELDQIQFNRDLLKYGLPKSTTEEQLAVAKHQYDRLTPGNCRIDPSI